MKKIFLMACAAAMIIAAGSVCAAQQKALKGSQASEQATAMTTKASTQKAVAVKETAQEEEDQIVVAVKKTAQKEADQIVVAGKASCKVGSHESHQWIKARNKNCTKCGTQKDSKGKKVFYCYCDCAKAEPQDTKCPKGTEFDKKTQKCVSKKCAKNQYIAGTKCVDCPANATCDGKTAKCNAGYQDVAKNIHEAVCKKTGLVCKKNQYIAGAKCVDCPANATCDGAKATCKKGLVASVKNGKVSCARSQANVNTIKK